MASISSNNNYVACAYTKDVSGQSQVFVKISDDYGATWGSAFQVSSISGGAYNASVVVDTANNVVVVFEATLDKAFRTIYKSDKLYSENSFTSPRILKSDAEYPENNPHIFINSNFQNSQAFVLYGSDQDGIDEVRLQTATYDDGAYITDDIKSIRVARDKEFKTGVFGAGDFTIVLDNSQGTYSNESQSSPFYGRLRSGIELAVELGVRNYTGTGSISDPTNWEEEFFPAIVGVASKFQLDSSNETLTISGRDRAEKLMAYRNFTSELYESKQVIELVTDLVTGSGSDDVTRPYVPISTSATQQTLSDWNEPLLSDDGSSAGDAGSNALTAQIINTIDFEAEGLGTIFYCSWLENDSIAYLWLLTREYDSINGFGKAFLSKWSNYSSKDGVVLNDSWDITSIFPHATENAHTVKSSEHDTIADCVWLSIGYNHVSDHKVNLYTFDFKNRVFSLKENIFQDNSSDEEERISEGGFITLDVEQNRLCFSYSDSYIPLGTFIRSHFIKYGYCQISYAIGGVPSLSSPTFFDVDTATELSPKTNFPTGAVKFGDYFYVIKGTHSYEDFEPFNYQTLAALPQANYYSGNTSQFGDSFYTKCNTAICYVDYTDLDVNGSTGQSFFNGLLFHRKKIHGLMYDDYFVWMAVSPTQEILTDAQKEGKIEIRKLASRRRYVKQGNIVSLDHTTFLGYNDNNTEVVYNDYESVRAVNNSAGEQNATEYVDGVFELTGASDIGNGMPDIPTNDYHINLETGEVFLKHLFDRKNTLLVDYDYKYSFRYAWFEDTSLWESIQEVASAGDFICYVSERGDLVFRDRFKYYSPILSDFTATLTSSWSGTPYQMLDNLGSPVTNIIPGLDYVIAYTADNTTGRAPVYKRRSYRVNGTTYIGVTGDYDINYDTGEIGWVNSGNIPEDKRVLIYFYASDYLFNFSYDSNVLSLKYEWGSERIINRVTVKGERYTPSISPISTREVYAVNPGDKVVNTGFNAIKQLQVDDSGENTLNQRQFDEYTESWKLQAGKPVVDLEFRNKVIGDTELARSTGKAIKLKIVPCIYPSDWSSLNRAPDEIPDELWVGDGYKINWEGAGDTGYIPNKGSQVQVEITNVEVKANGIRIEVNHLESSDQQYYLQVEIIGYPLSRISKFTALHEDLASIQQYYVKSFELENRFIGDMKTAQIRAKQITRHYADERPDVQISVLGCPFIELGNIVSVRDINSGLSGDYFEVIGINDNYTNDSYVTNLKLRKVAEAIGTNTGIDNPVIGYGGGYFNKTPLPNTLFLNS